MTNQTGDFFADYGVPGGFGLGIGYISPVSTLIKWFPDGPGTATGMAIMGSSGGAFNASPLSVFLMRRFSTPTHVGGAETFIMLGVIYFAFMTVGAFIVRLPRRAVCLPVTSHRQRRGNGSPRTMCSSISAEDATVLADLVGAVPERDRRHWGAGPGIRHEPGDVPRTRQRRGGRGFRGPDEPVQHGWPVLLGIRAGRHRPQEHLFRVLCTRLRGLVHSALRGCIRQRRPVLAVLLWHHQRVPRWLLHSPGVAARYVRHAVCRHDPWSAADRVVRSWHLRTRAGRLYPAIQRRSWSPESRRVQQYHVHHGWAAGDRISLQSRHSCGAQTTSHGGRRVWRDRCGLSEGRHGHGNAIWQHIAAPDSALGVRRHPPDLRRDRDPAERAEAVPVARAPILARSASGAVILCAASREAARAFDRPRDDPRSIAQ